jgi:nucleoside phosphorylase
MLNKTNKLLENYVPQEQFWFPNIPPIEVCNTSKIEQRNVIIDILLVTATPTEKDSVLNCLTPLEGESIWKITVGHETYYVGRCGIYTTALLMCEMGISLRGSAMLATYTSIQLWRPKAVIMVGIAFGKDSKKQNVADVLIADQIISYELQRVGKKETIYRGSKREVGETLLNRFRNIDNWIFSRPDGSKSKAYIGPLLSGEKLVDNLKFRSKLFKQFPEAIGGEMEGTGVAAASDRIGIEWILVKAICDWGDGAKNKKHQQLAAAASASIVKHVLNDRNFIENLRIPFFGELLYSQFSTTSASVSKDIRTYDFQTLVEERTKEFVGRDFLTRRINKLLKPSNLFSGYILIKGEPGIGKTAFMAELVKSRGYLHHFNISSQNIRTAKDFLSNICAQIITYYHLPYSEIPESSIHDSGLFSRLLAEAVQKIEDKLVILIDAIDEAEISNLLPDANSLLLPSSLPERVVIVLTSRLKDNYRLVVDHQVHIEIDDESEENMADAEMYIRNFVERHQQKISPVIEYWKKDKNAFIQILRRKSQGNFMYLVHVLRDILVGKLGPNEVDDIKNLPEGLKAYYQRHWNVMTKKGGSLFIDKYTPVICFLATARAPVTVNQISEWAKLDNITVKVIINEWHEYLNTIHAENRDTLYYIYHDSFRDFLEGEVGLKNYHKSIAYNAFAKIRGFL